MTIAFTIPGRPTAWQRTVTSKGVRFTPADMRAQQKVIGTLCRVAMGRMDPLTGALKLEILAVYEIPKSWPPAKQAAAKAGKVWKTTVPDWDNLAKQVGDALNGVAYKDDAQIVVAQVGKRYGYPERTEVKITALDVLCDNSPKAAIRDMADRLAGQTTMLSPPEKARNTK